MVSDADRLKELREFHEETWNIAYNQGIEDAAKLVIDELNGTVWRSPVAKKIRKLRK